LIDRSALVRLGASAEAETWAERIQRALAARNRDLVVAAVLEVAGPVVLHHDKDFELNAGITRQSVQCLAG
jgi:predicted nucleic acid-binding protein